MTKLQKVLKELEREGKLTFSESVAIFGACEIMGNWTMVDREDYEGLYGTNASAALDDLVRKPD